MRVLRLPQPMSIQEDLSQATRPRAVHPITIIMQPQCSRSACSLPSLMLCLKAPSLTIILAHHWQPSRWRCFTKTIISARVPTAARSYPFITRWSLITHITLLRALQQLLTSCLKTLPTMAMSTHSTINNTRLAWVPKD